MTDNFLQAQFYLHFDYYTELRKQLQVLTYCAILRNSIALFEILFNYLCMKRFLLSIIVLIAPSLCLCRERDSLFQYIDIYTGMELAVPLDEVCSTEKFTPYAERQSGNPFLNKSTLKSSSSCRIVFKHITMFGSASLKDTRLISFQSPIQLVPDIHTNWGVSLHLGDAKTAYSAEILFGTLHFSRAISRLKNPRLSSSSSLFRSAPFAEYCAPSLPSRSSTNSSVWFSVHTSPSKKRNFLPTLEASYSLEGEWLFGIGTSFCGLLVPGDFLLQDVSFSLSITGGMFSHEGNSPSSWYADTPRYCGSLRPAGEAVVSLSLPHFATSNAFGAYTTPFCTGMTSSSDATSGPGNFYFRTQNSLLFGPCSFTASFFTTDDGTYPASGTLLHTRRQLQFMPQCSFSLLGTPLRLGALGGIDWKTTSSAIPVPYRTFTFRFDAEYVPNSIRTALHTLYSFSEEDANSSCKLNLSFSKLLPTMKMSLALSSALTPKKDDYSFGLLKTSWAAHLSLSGMQTPLYSAELSGSLSTDSGRMAGGTGSASVSFSFKQKWFRWTGKLAFLATF